MNKGFLTLVNHLGEEAFIELSPLQLQAVVLLLGIEPGAEHGTINCLSDKSLLNVCEKTIFKIKKK